MALKINVEELTLKISPWAMESDLVDTFDKKMLEEKAFFVQRWNKVQSIQSRIVKQIYL